MSILLFTGVPGSGKTFSAVQLTIKPALELGRPIRTNIPLDLDEIRSTWIGCDVQVFDGQPDWAAFPPGALIVLDEIWKFWPVGGKQKEADPAAVELLRMHRHRVGKCQQPGAAQGADLSQEIVLINQGKRFASWIKELIDKTYIVRKLDAVGAEKQYRLDVYQGFQETDRPYRRDHIRGFVGTYDPRVYKLYRSHTQSQASVVDPQELRADRKATVWSGWTVRLALVGPLVAGVAIWYAFTHVNTFLGVDDKSAAPPVVQASSKPVPPPVFTPPVPAPSAIPVAPPSAPAPSAAPVPVVSDLVRVSQWRLSGSLQYQTGPKAGTWAVILTRGRDRRYLQGVECEHRQGEVICQVDGAEVSGYSGTVVDTWSAVDPGKPTG